MLSLHRTKTAAWGQTGGHGSLDSTFQLLVRYVEPAHIHNYTHRQGRRALQIDSEEQAVHEHRSGAEKRLQEIQGIKDAHAKERRKAKAKLTTLEAQIAKCDPRHFRSRVPHKHMPELPPSPPSVPQF